MCMSLRRSLFLFAALLFAGHVQAQTIVGDWSGKLPNTLFMLSSGQSVLHLDAGGSGSLSVPSLRMMGATSPNVLPLTYSVSGNTINFQSASLGNFSGSVNGSQITFTRNGGWRGIQTWVMTSAPCTPYAAFMGDWQLSGVLTGQIHLGAGGMGTQGSNPVNYSVNANTISITMGQGLASREVNATLNGSQMSGQLSYGANVSATLVSGTGQPACPMAAGVAGNWAGTLPSSNIPVIFQLGAGGTGTLSSTGQGGLALPLTYTVDRYSISINIPVLSSQASYTALMSGNQMSGTFNQNGQSPSLTLTKQ